ncbi:MAG: hypothetical protein ABFD79_05330 [Phycisphaerales bacterium]
MKAFPITSHNAIFSSGMDLRDFFAGMALQGMVTNEGIGDCGHVNGLARVSYELADAMMKAREEQNNG